MKSRLVIIKSAGYIIWQLFLRRRLYRDIIVKNKNVEYQNEHNQKRAPKDLNRQMLKFDLTSACVILRLFDIATTTRCVKYND